MKLIRWLKHELKELAVPALYFFICFSLILLILKLFLQNYSIEFFVLSKAALAAFLAAKAVLIGDQTGISKKRRSAPRYINVLFKTFIYTVITAILSILESLIEAFSKTKVFSTAISTAINEININHFLAIILLVSLVFLSYNIFDEINIYMGEGKLKKFFFSKPQ